MGFSEAARDGQVRISTGPGEVCGPEESTVRVERDGGSPRAGRRAELPGTKSKNGDSAAALKINAGREDEAGVGWGPNRNTLTQPLCP